LQFDLSQGGIAKPNAKYDEKRLDFHLIIV